MDFRDYQGYKNNVCAYCPDKAECEQTDIDIDNCTHAATPFELGGDARTPQH